MIGLLPILARWRLGLGIFGALAFLGLALAANHYRHAYHAEKALRAADKANYIAAQAEAANIAQAALRAQEAKYQANAMEAHLAYQTDLNRARAAASAYIGRMRVSAPQGAASNSTSGPEGSGSTGGERPGAPPFMVAVSASDVDICTENTARLDAVRGWVATLNK